MTTINMSLEGITPEAATSIMTHILNTHIDVDRVDMISIDREVKGVPDPEPNPAFVSPVPEGYDTILGYLAKHHPEALQFDMWDAQATLRDGYWCTHRVKERGLVVCKVPAPTVLSERNKAITTVNAYPLHLLHERFSGGV